jgi:hypothetical protein
MPHERNPQGGPSQGPKDEPNRPNVKKIQSADERTERTQKRVHGGSGRRNGSDKNR